MKLPPRAEAARAWARAHPWVVVEVLAAAALLTKVLSDKGMVGLISALAVATARGILSSFALLSSDTSGAAATSAAALARTAMILAPPIRWARTWQRRHYVWLPVTAVPLFIFLGLSFAAISTPAMWILLAAASAVGFLAAPRRRIGWLALAPALVCGEPSLSHSPISDRYWTTEKLAPRCAVNDGQRPEGFSPDMAVSRYYSVTQLDDDTAIVVGDRRSFWMKRRPEGGFSLEKPSKARGNLWQGCVMGRTVYFTKRNHFFRVERLPEGSALPERFTDIKAPDPPGIIELDFAEPSCDPVHERVFATELNNGGIRELSLRDESQRRFQVGGFNLQYMRRRDGMLVGIDTARLVVFDPDAGRVIEQHAAGLGVMGIDICMTDDAVAITDMAGRLRVFERSASGEYRFHSGTFVAAPRRVAFSPDCRMIGVTSADDHTVWSLRRADLSVAKRYRVGPGLRDITFTGPRQMAIADACTATFLDAGE